MNQHQSTKPAVILTFDPKGRQSSRRGVERARQQRRQTRRERQKLAAEAQTLRITLAAFEADADLHASYPAVRDVEAAYRESPEAGRRALLAVLNEYFCDGCASGADDERAKSGRQLSAAFGR